MKNKFAILIDHTAEFSKNEIYRPILINAEDILDAMFEAEKYMDETVYLIKILRRVPLMKVEICEGCKKIRYEEILVNRGHGWKPADRFHNENSTIWSHSVSSNRKSHWEDWDIVYTRYA